MIALASETNLSSISALEALRMNCDQGSRMEEAGDLVSAAVSAVVADTSGMLSPFGGIAASFVERSGIIQLYSFYVILHPCARLTRRREPLVVREGAGAATAQVGCAEGHAVCWHTARPPHRRNAARRNASGVTDTWMARTRQGGRRVRNASRRACARGGEATLRALALLHHRPMREIECPKCRFGGGAICWSRPVHHLRRCVGGNPTRQTVILASVITSKSPGPANVLTLSCKSRPPRRPPVAARRLPRLTTEWQERTAADVTRRAVRAAQGGSPPSQGSAVFVSL